MVDYKKAAMAALGVGGIAYGLGLAYAKSFPQGIANLTFSAVEVPVRAQIQAGIDTTLAGKLLSYLGGVIPQGGMWGALIYLFVASFLVVLGAMYIGDRLTVFKSGNVRFGAGMAVTAGVIGLLLGSMSPSIGSAGVATAMFIYYVFIATLYGLARQNDAIARTFPAL